MWFAFLFQLFFVGLNFVFGWDEISYQTDDATVKIGFAAVVVNKQSFCFFFILFFTLLVYLHNLFSNEGIEFMSILLFNDVDLLDEYVINNILSYST